MSKLPRAPLKEAVFEVRWPLQPDETGRQLTDPDYPFALGKFRDALKDCFPEHVAKFPQATPHHLFKHQVAHQFWQTGRKWPVTQLGPGIATVNDTEQNYDWEATFLPNVTIMLQALEKAYGPLSFNLLSLRYIDVVRIADYDFTTWEEFVQQHINFNFNYQFNTRGSLARFNFEQAFDLGESGFLNVSFSNGQNDVKEDVFIWQTAVVKKGHLNQEQVLSWLIEAHKCTSDLFKDICKKDFYASFGK